SSYKLSSISTALKPTVVKFIDPSIAGAVDLNRVEIASHPIHLIVAGSLTKVLGSLEVLSEFNQDVQVQNPPPDFAAPPDSPGVFYVGYVIERYDLQPDGSMTKGREIMIDDPSVDEFIDQRVSYGGTYAYRIR